MRSDMGVAANGGATETARASANMIAGVSAARQRKLHVGHFAFMRSVVQGLDPRESWERYFRVEGEAADARTVRATIACVEVRIRWEWIGVGGVASSA